MISYFLQRQDIAVIELEDDNPVYNAMLALLNHIRENFTETIPTIDILYSKIEDEVKKVNKAIPALYALFTATDWYKAKDHMHEIPLVVLTDTKHLDKPTHFASGVGLASRLTEWLLANHLFNDEADERVYQIVSPIHLEPYSVTERYAVVLLLVKIHDRTI